MRTSAVEAEHLMVSAPHIGPQGFRGLASGSMYQIITYLAFGE